MDCVRLHFSVESFMSRKQGSPLLAMSTELNESDNCIKGYVRIWLRLLEVKISTFTHAAGDLHQRLLLEESLFDAYHQVVSSVRHLPVTFCMESIQLHLRPVKEGFPKMSPNGGDLIPVNKMPEDWRKVDLHMKSFVCTNTIQDRDAIMINDPKLLFLAEITSLSLQI
ncbi:hypothetical protein Btru_072507, partial [Bulinus truncatus]